MALHGDRQWLHYVNEPCVMYRIIAAMYAHLKLIQYYMLIVS